MSSERIFPAKWLIDPKWEAKDHLMNLKGKDYLNVQNRLLWFIRDQRQLIAAGLATTSYVIKTSVVEHDREKGYAHFKTYVRDVLGNEATMYGSETAKDFGDYAEKASTKSLGRALLCLGYGTGMAPEMDESDERPVDSPVERKKPVTLPAVPGVWPEQPTPAKKKMATDVQRERMEKYRDALEISDRSIATADNGLDYDAAEARISTYIEQWKQRKLRETTATVH